MRDRIRTFMTLALLLTPALCAAQRAAEWRDSAQRSYAAMRALHDSLMQGDSTAVPVAHQDDVALAASPNETANAIAALDQFAAVRARHFGRALPAGGGFRMVVRTDGLLAGGGMAEGSVVVTGGPDSGNSVRIRGRVTTRQLASYLLDHYGEMMVASVPPLHAWIRTPPPLSMDDAERRNQSMYALATSTGDASRGCIAGDVGACARALHLVDTAAADSSRGLSQFVRADLLFYALDRGGPEAWERLRAAADSGPAAMLAAASRQPTDVLLAEWRRSLLVLRPQTPPVTVSSTLIALAWTAMLVAGALGASRWA